MSEIKALKKGQVYKGFKVLETVKIDDYDSIGFYLVHERTGMEIFHLFNNDSENLFAFAFRTPSQDSSGMAHVLEHSVLCGSENYPLKDPFIRMAGQSVNSYMNALTAADRTMYPVSSPVKADYFNLMSVYADAVFFPLLKKEIFLQEAHRLELDAEEKPSIQGVVYNEMKGLYSSFENVAQNVIDSPFCKGTIYKYDSGGDPLKIPSLTLKKLKAFHAKYYNPANAMLFLYGNIPTCEQLDFLENNLLSRFKKGGKKFSVNISLPKKIPSFIKGYGPALEDKDDGRGNAVLTWDVSNLRADDSFESMELSVLAELLWGDDSAPVSKALLESNLGEDLAPQSGGSMQTLIKTLSIGLRGVKEENAEKVREIIFKTLSEVAEKGIDSSDLKRTCSAFDFMNREIVRFNGPYSLVLMRRCFRSWTYGGKPWSYLFQREMFEVIKEKLNCDKNYVPSLIRRFLLDNKRECLAFVLPSSSWSKERRKEETLLTEKLYSRKGRKKTLLEVEKMLSFQNDEKEDSSVLPFLRKEDLPSSGEQKLSCKIEKHKGLDVFLSKEATNGITYVQISFPTDVISYSDYPFLSLLAYAASDIGWKDNPWYLAMQKFSALTGGLNSFVHTSSMPYEVSEEEKKEKKYLGRDWFSFTFKCLEENIEESFDLMAEAICKIDFSDSKKLKELVKSSKNDDEANITNTANSYASMRASRHNNRVNAVTELWNGLSAYLFELRLCKGDFSLLGKKFKSLYDRIKKGGSVIHITGDKKGLDMAKKCLDSFIEKARLLPLKDAKKQSAEKLYSLTDLVQNAPEFKVKKNEIKNKDDFTIDEVWTIPGSVGYASSVIKSSSYTDKNSLSDAVFCQIEENGDLWKKVRMTGGAYGVYLNPSTLNGISRFASYRDPKPLLSAQAFYNTLQEACNKEFSAQEVEKAVLACYSSELEPMTPSSRGKTAFLRTIYGIKSEIRTKRFKELFKVSPESVKKSAIRYKEESKNTKTVVIMAKSLLDSKIKEKCGKIYELPL